MKDALKPLPQFDHDLQVRKDEETPARVSRFQPYCSCEWEGEWHEGLAPDYAFLGDRVEDAAWAEAGEHAEETLLPALVALSHRYRGRRVRVVSRAQGGMIYEGVCLAPRTEPADRAIVNVFGHCHFVLRESSQSYPHIAARNIVAVTPLAA